MKICPVCKSTNGDYEARCTYCGSTFALSAEDLKRKDAKLFIKKLVDIRRFCVVALILLVAFNLVYYSYEDYSGAVIRSSLAIFLFLYIAIAVAIYCLTVYKKRLTDRLAKEELSTPILLFRQSEVSEQPVTDAENASEEVAQAVAVSEEAPVATPSQCTAALPKDDISLHSIFELLKAALPTYCEQSLRNYYAALLSTDIIALFDTEECALEIAPVLGQLSGVNPQILETNDTASPDNWNEEIKARLLAPVREALRGKKQECWLPFFCQGISSDNVNLLFQNFSNQFQGVLLTLALESNEVYSPLSFADVCAYLSLEKRKESVMRGDETAQLTLPQLSKTQINSLLGEALESKYLSEDVWKKFDSLEALLQKSIDFKIDNRLACAVERFVAVLLTVDASEAEALDAALACFLLPYAVAELGGETAQLSEFLDSAFGLGNLPLTVNTLRKFRNSI